MRCLDNNFTRVETGTSNNPVKYGKVLGVSPQYTCWFKLHCQTSLTHELHENLQDAVEGLEPPSL